MRRNSLKKKLFNILSDIKYKSFNLSNGEKVVFVWLIFSFLSLFFPWVLENDPNLWVDVNTFNWFHEKVWNPWIFIMLIILVVIFNLFSKEKKEKIKLYSNFRFNSNSIYINTWILISLISIICFNFASALSTYSSYIYSGNWPIICLTWWIAVFIGSFLNRNNNEKLNTYINDTDEGDFRENNERNNNMKLPF